MSKTSNETIEYDFQSKVPENNENNIQQSYEKVDAQQNGFILSSHHRLPHEQRLLFDGSVKSIGVVVKQTTFSMAITSKCISLENTEIECNLVYDNDELTEVSYINQRPLTFNSFLNSNKTMNVEVKILVLSSQHEDMLFRIRFDLYDHNHQKIVCFHIYYF